MIDWTRDRPAIDRSAVGKARFFLLEGETLAAGLKRMLIAEIVDARTVLADPAIARDERVHRVRRRLKWVRSLWSVLDPVPGANQKERRNQIRAAATALAGARDADVLAGEARRIADQAEGRAGDVAKLLRDRLQAAAELAHREAPPIDEVVARLSAAEADARSLPERFEAGRLLAEALTACYRRGRQDWREIDDGTSTAALHDWRKRVKQRRHLSALVPFDTPVTTPAIQADLEELGEILGEEHDLALLTQRLQEAATLLGEREGRDLILDLVAKRRRKLKKTAIGLGEELYGARTRDFAAELHGLDEL